MSQKDIISICGASEHNLSNIDIDIPRNRLVVFTGVSGSGKSSLAFDTIYAEGQRRYVESLSAYARQFLGQMEKPHVESISGLSPAISIEQKSSSKNPRSTVGTITEIYDYLRVLYARVGKQHCHKCGQPVGAQTLEQMLDIIMEELPPKTRFMILAPQVQDRKGEYREVFDDARNEGFVRVRVNGEVRDLDEDIKLDRKMKHRVEIVVDRLVMRSDVRPRLSESVETALALGGGTVIVAEMEGDDHLFSESNACVPCGISFPELSPQAFSFNSPAGRCPSCDGLGRRLEIDPDLVVPHKEYSIRAGALVPWKTLFDKGRTAYHARKLRKQLQELADENGFSLSTPFGELSKKHQNMVLYGSSRPRPGVAIDRKARGWNGMIPRIEFGWRNTTSEGYRSFIMENFMHQVECPTCGGGRLRQESQHVKIGDKTLPELCSLCIRESIAFFEALQLSDLEQEIAGQVLREINNRLVFLGEVGLHYLSLERNAPTLSGGEAQRIRLASQIGSGLMGVLYILDEPSIGLHQRDNRKLLGTLKHLRDLGNTVIVVEHDEETIRECDHVIDFGPGAGKLGGEVIFQGTPKAILRSRKSLTGQYLSGKKCIEIPEQRRKAGSEVIVIRGAKENNLKNIDVRIPLGLFTCVTGVSGSGKSSLVIEILHKALAHELHQTRISPGKHKDITGLHHLDKVINIDQRPIGRTPRSNPATYVKVFDPIRYLFAELPEAKVRGYKPGRFSFNVKGGRCEACQGAGVKCIEMHFLADVFVTCDVCDGRRFNRETLQVKYKGFNISQILQLTVVEALELFDAQPKIKRILSTLHDVGLDYIQLGQRAPTLSGGEAQRVKLAKELCKIATGRTLYILDEPTTGLHFDDIKKLLKVLSSLVDRGNTVVVIEHNLDVIKCSDYIIDLGPEGGDGGGEVVAAGSPLEVMDNPDSHTGEYLSAILDGE
jgi:excinuclease ABC subunit A